MSAVSRIFHTIKGGGRPTASRLSRWRAVSRTVLRQVEKLKKLDDRELMQAGLEIRWRAKAGIPLLKLMPEAYALVVESSRRTTGMTPYSVQIMGGIGLFEGGIAEMQTGEGKTLTAVLVTFLRALPGRGYHVITVNDYLAKRDAEHMGPIYAALGSHHNLLCTIGPMQFNRRRFHANFLDQPRLVGSALSDRHECPTTDQPENPASRRRHNRSDCGRVLHTSTDLELWRGHPNFG